MWENIEILGLELSKQEEITYYRNQAIINKFFSDNLLA